MKGVSPPMLKIFIRLVRAAIPRTFSGSVGPRQHRDPPSQRISCFPLLGKCWRHPRRRGGRSFGERSGFWVQFRSPVVRTMSQISGSPSSYPWDWDGLPPQTTQSHHLAVSLPGGSGSAAGGAVRRDLPTAERDGVGRSFEAGGQFRGSPAGHLFGGGIAGTP